MTTYISDTTAYGSAVGDQWRVSVKYSVDFDGDTTYTLHAWVVATSKNATWAGGTINPIYEAATYKETVTLEGSDVAPYVNTSTKRYVNTNDVIIQAGHGNRTANFVVSLYMSGKDPVTGTSLSSGTSSLTIPIVIPSVPNWQVTYNANGGSGAPAAQTKWYNETLLLSKTTPTRSNATANRVVTFTSHGTTAWPVTNCPTSLTSVATTKYTFSKWQKSGTSSYYYPNTAYSDNAALPLVAVWNSSTTATAITLPSPTRTGYNFNGWYTAASGGTRVGGAGSSYTPSASITLHAQWTEKTYTIKFDGNGGTGVPANQTKYHTTALTIPSTPKPTRTNYVFKNWNTIKAGTGTSFNAGGNYTLNGNATLYAQYYAPYIISYGANGGSNAPANTVKPYNTSVNLTSDSPTYAGMTFLGWNTNSTSTGTHYDSGAEIAANANANLSLYAVWRGVSVDVIRPKRNGTSVSFTADWSLKGSVAGSGSIIAEYAKNTSSTWTSITLTGTKTLTKSAGNPTTGSVSGTFTLPVADSCRIRLTATFNDSYGTTSSTSTHTTTATRTTTVGKPFKLFSALHGGNGLAIGVIASLANTLEVAWKAVFGGTVTSKNSEIDPSSAAGTDTWVNGFRFVDTNDTFLGAVQVGQDANNNLYTALATRRAVDDSYVWNRIKVMVGSDGSQTYVVSDAQAFREAINAVQCVNAATMKAVLGSLSGSDQWWYLCAWCVNSANTGKNGHRLGLLMTDTTIQGYDWDASGTKTQWTAYTTANKPSLSALGAQAAGNYVTFPSGGNSSINTPGGSTQLWSLYSTVLNSANTTKNSHRIGLFTYNTHIALYDSTDSAWLWSAYTTANKPTPADIGAQPAGNYATNGGATMNGRFSSLSTASQLWCLAATCVNSNNTTYYQKQQLVGFTNTNMFLYDSAGSSTIWTAYTTANKPTPAAIGAASTNSSGTINNDTFSAIDRAFYIQSTVNNSRSDANGDNVRLYVGLYGLSFYNATDSKGYGYVNARVTLYSNNSGTSGTVTLTSSYAQGNSVTNDGVLGLLIMYKDNDGYQGSTFARNQGTTYDPVSLRVVTTPQNNGKTFIKHKSVKIFTSSISNDYYGETDISAAGNISQGSSNHIYITAVYAYYNFM